MACIDKPVSAKQRDSPLHVRHNIRVWAQVNLQSRATQHAMLRSVHEGNMRCSTMQMIELALLEI
jgi:hypothetical protein